MSLFDIYKLTKNLTDVEKRIVIAMLSSSVATDKP